MGKNLAHKSQDNIEKGDTPMMAQYKAIKEEHPDCLLFYRMGDFYELFFEDAIIASSILDITLTKRGKTKGTDIEMCGVPFHSYEPYLSKLISAGYKVGICEQTETPEEAKKRGGHKALVKREVVRIVTKGTLTEDNLLNSRENNYIASIGNNAGSYAVSWLELSTGEFKVQPIIDKQFESLFNQVHPSEILISSGISEYQFIKDATINYENLLTILPDVMFSSNSALDRLKKLYETDTLDSFGDFSKSEISAAGTLIEYVERTQKGKLPYISLLQRVNDKEVMEIDASTRRSLEITQTLSGEKSGSLLSYIDKTITSAGARLLQSRISAPLYNLDKINDRLDQIEFFIQNKNIISTIRDILKPMPDMERALSRISAQRGGPRDLGAIQKSIEIIKQLTTELDQAKMNESVKKLQEMLLINSEVEELHTTLNRALKDELPYLPRDGNFIKPEFNEELDKYNHLKTKSKTLIANLESQYKSFTSIDKLKISFNNVLGYFIEIPSKKAEHLIVRKGQQPSNDNPFIHRQTMANAIRFTTAELSELERDISQANEKSLAIELELFKELENEIIRISEQLVILSNTVSKIDVSCSLALLSIEMDYTRPVVDLSKSFEIINGRHPVVELAIKETSGNTFIPNNCNLSEQNSLWLLTGPNMAGKSTFLRQNALIAILSQIGSYVPAESAHIGLVDKLFSRVGASDDLARGRSTFMVEMVETAAILNQATDRSLVILDEIGRGTSTFDGLSIAWASVEHLHEVNRSRGIFATHYHELTSLISKLDRLVAYSMQVKEWKGDIVFLHSVKAGSADQSYGIHVAKLAGLPKSVTLRARQVLDTLQKSEQSGTLSSLADDLPLFQSIQTTEDTSDYTNNELRDFVENINPDEISPRQAIDIIYELKNLTS
jgi:DNA mismatch repair protein MutS